jgi:tRNA A-37 threonylcarbamoyl transferase component Bud32/membrane-associated phospholipid phosphatase
VTPSTRTGDRAEPESQLEDVAEEGPFESLPVIRRRRPSGDARPARVPLGRPGWIWVGVELLVVLLWAWMIQHGSAPSWLDRIDAATGRALAQSDESGLASASRGLALLGSVGAVMAARWLTIGTLIVFHRGRHLVTYVAAILVTRLLTIGAVWAIGRPRPAVVVPYGYGWKGYAHPSASVAMLAVGLAGAAWSLAPRGTARAVLVGAGAGAVALLGVARVALGVDHPSDVIVAGVAGWGVATLAFRIFCPEEVFPVRYRRGRAAHLEIDERRRAEMDEAFEDQVGMELLDVEPFGEEGSGGSTPLKVGVRRAGGTHTEELFAKLYSATHLRADRWYKLGRTIRYGALEDESSFNTVRRLVEHEDYMLRLMREAGVSAVEPRGIVELEPEREYVILMTLLRRAEEADEDAPVDESVIDAGLRIVRAMWDHGLAHRDLKPANILIHDGEVSLIDVAFGEIRPSPWRQAVDLANMMLVLALPTDADRVYARAEELFSTDDIGEAFAAAQGPAIPRQLREKLADDDGDLVSRFRELAPDRDPISVQRWSLRRVALAAQAAAMAAVLLVLLAFNLANPTAP